MTELPRTTYAELQDQRAQPLYETLWKEYFQATTINDRPNSKQQIRCLPKRYWRHLPEMQG